MPDQLEEVRWRRLAYPEGFTMTMSVSSVTRRAFLCGLTTTVLPPWSFSLAQGQGQAPIRHPRGAQAPARLKWNIKHRNSSAASVNSLLQSIPGLEEIKPKTAIAPADAKKYDWRDKKMVTPVKDQGYCGSCRAFGAVAAYESAYAIANGGTWVYVSEQELVDCAFGDFNCVTGGWHEVAFMYVDKLGLVGSDKYFYSGTKSLCAANFARDYFLLNWGYVSDNLMASTLELKKAILQYGPVVSAVLTDTSWDNYSKFDDPNWNADFPNGVFSGTPSQPEDKAKTDHEVLIVGWDDTLGSQGVWLIKNSWGTRWGDDGYMKLPYGCNSIGYGASWVLAPDYRKLTPALAETLQLVKVQPQAK